MRNGNKVLAMELLFWTRSSSTGPVKVGAVVDGGLVRWGASKDRWLPHVEVRVKVDDGEGTVGGVDGHAVRLGR